MWRNFCQIWNFAVYFHLNHFVERVLEVWVIFKKLSLISPLPKPINCSLVQMLFTLFMSIKIYYIGPCCILQK